MIKIGVHLRKLSQK